MDAQEFRNLQEAYLDVVENQQLDEAKSKLPTRGIDPEFYSQFYGNASRTKKVKGAKTPQAGQNKYLTKQNQKRSAARYAADMGRDRTPSASDYDNHGGGSRNEQYDLYDIILSHLLDEGYADTQQAAEAIMVNMSEDWREDIVEASVDYERPQTDDEIEKARNERRFGKQGFNQVGQTKLRRQLHKSQRGVTKKDARRWEGEK
jgi:hypothetical protein